MTAALAVPLVVFGGSVTTLGAGMAVDGWLIAEGHFLLAFPVEKWFRDLATFVEHTHRLFGMAVGLAAVVTVVVAFREKRSASTRALTIAALAAICLQGTLGGLRVLESSPELAFLHGALAHAVFAFLCLVAFLVKPSAPGQAESGTNPGASGRPSEGMASLAPLAVVAAGLVYGQVVLGAWYRHGLRTEGQVAAAGSFVAHLAGSLAVMAVLFLTIARLASLARTAAIQRDAIDRAGRRLGILLGLQVLLGLLAWAGFRPDSVGLLEWAFSVLHVLVGALLLAQTVIVAAVSLQARRGVLGAPTAVSLEGGR